VRDYSVLVLCEDEATFQLSSGFLENAIVRPRYLRLEPYLTGWPSVGQRIEREIPWLESNPQNLILAIVDFDTNPSKRIGTLTDKVPAHLHAQVLVLGPHHKMQKLKAAITEYTNFSRIGFAGLGRALADACEANAPWLETEPQLAYATRIWRENETRIRETAGGH
jgi:hypothetical protein